MLKQRRFTPILAAALVMLVLVVCAAWTQNDDLLTQVRFQDSVRGQNLDLFYDEAQDSYVLFLPSYVSPGDLVYSCPEGFTVGFGEGKTLEDAPLSENLEVTVSSGLHFREYVLRLEPCSPIPSIFVEGEEGLLEYLHADKKNTRDVVVNLVDDQGDTMHHGISTMYGRGNGSWESPSKRPYNLEFASPISVGPFENVTKLCLLAEFSDESKLRNSLAYYAGKELGIDYASDYQYINLYVNGEYLGLYGIVTKQEYRKYLVSDEIQAVFEIASGQNPVEFKSGMGWRINVMHGSKQLVQQRVEDFESALKNMDWQRCAEVIDLSSFARKYALEEFLANLDLSYASQYFYLDKDNVIHCMLPWDYDWTLGSSFSYFNNRQANELKVCRNMSSWYSILLENEDFRLAAAEVWEKEFDDAFLAKLENRLLEDIDTIGPSWACDKLRWKYSLPYNGYELASGVEDLEGFYGLFRDYFYQRRPFLIDYFRNREDYCYVRFYGYQWAFLFVPRGADLHDYIDGATILDVKTPGENFLGWYTEDGRPLEEVGTVTESISIIGYYEEIETARDYVWTRWLDIVIVLAFGSLALGLFLSEMKRLGKKRKL